MVSLETIQATSTSMDQTSSPRISFSAELVDESDFISITPSPQAEKDHDNKEREKTRNAEFEFFLGNVSSDTTMLTADELFFEGKLVPLGKMQQSEKPKMISLKSKEDDHQKQGVEVNKEKTRVSWFVDDDPSPRPPKCTVLWKELMRLKKQRSSSLSPSPSSSSTSSSSSSLGDIASTEEGKAEKHVNRIKKGLERTRSSSIRIRPMVNVPICTQVKSSALPPLFPLKKGRLER